MELQEYIKEAIKTINHGTADEVYLTGKLSSEAMELFQPALKAAYHGKAKLPDEEFDEELGDLLWYVVVLATYRGRNMHNIMEKNIEKLRVRHGTSYNAIHYTQE